MKRKYTCRYLGGRIGIRFTLDPYEAKELGNVLGKVLDNYAPGKVPDSENWAFNQLFELKDEIFSQLGY